LNTKKIKSLVISVLLANLLFLPNLSVAGETISSQDTQSSLKASASSIENVKLDDTQSYENYFSTHEKNGYGGQDIALDISSIQPDSNGYILGQTDGKPVIITEEEGFVEWPLHIEKEGFYSIAVDYLQLPSETVNNIPLTSTQALPKGNNEDAGREVYIDGKLPFAEASSVLFTRMWKDATAIQSVDGNDVRPEQEEVLQWRQKNISDSLGYYGERLYFYFSVGTHTLRLTSLREPMAIKGITLNGSKDDYPTYDQYLSDCKKNGAKVIDKQLGEKGYTQYEAESTTSKSNPSIFPISDRTSPSTSPSDFSRIRLNSIGGEKWKMPGQWITWTVDVPKSGLYKIVLRSRQNIVRGMYTNRKIYIDGKLPFQEAAEIRFNYSDDWKVEPIGGKDTPYLFYLEKGSRQITMTVGLGNLSRIMALSEKSLSKLNEAYWQLLTIIGLDPDQYRDYNIDKYHPEVIKTFKEQAAVLEGIAVNFEKSTGQKDSYTSILHQLSQKMRNMAINPKSIPNTFREFKDNIGSFGDWISKSREQPLSLDYILLAEDSAKLPRAESGFWNKLMFHLQQFLSSFTVDYNAFGGKKAKDSKDVVVWIGSGATGGRDQAQVLRQIINNGFMVEHPNIHMNLQLIPPGTILTASLSGKGPDIALQIGGTDSVNYAMRNAIVDLTKFDDFETMKKRFQPSAFTPFSYAKNDTHTGIYALPETQTFPMLFYRKDILKELGIDIEKLQTWDDIIGIMPLLQKSHMTFGLPSTLSSFATFLYQNGGGFYKNGGRQSDLDSKISLESFKQWTNYYVSYRLNLEYNFETRFRMGEMPLAIADYTSYNMLSMSAPEINGLWGMAVIPGVKGKDGVINNVAPAGGAGAIIMSRSKVPKESWEFLKWWTSSPVQEQFGREIESVLGTAGRYSTANIDALKKLPWPAADRRVLMRQWDNTQGIPEVPGGYYTTRYVDFSLRDVVNKNQEPREVLLQNVTPINEEIKIKRKELRLG
jgi:ABC-type glycerol-3-phosphate transport system substrate-binding protein